MNCTEEQSYTYSETLEILQFVSEEYKDRIPQKLISIFEENRLISYSEHIDKATPLESQTLSDKTCALLALLALNYWCDSENQKEDLRSIFDENEKVYQDSLIDKYDPYNIFSNTKKIEKKLEQIPEPIQELPIEQEELPIYKKIFNKVIKIIKDKIKK